MTTMRTIIIGMTILWLFLGSFGEVLLGRFERFSLDDILSGNKDFLKALRLFAIGRSHCNDCKHELQAVDLIPVVSRLSTGRKCRYCKKPLSRVYPALEVWSALIVGLTAYLVYPVSMGSIGYVLLRVVASRLLYLLLVHDIRTMYLHEPVRVILCAIVLAIIFATPYTIRWNSALTAIMRWVTMAVFFIGLYYGARFYVKRKTWEKWEWFGMWDVRLAPVIGCLLGTWYILHLWADETSIAWFLIFRQYITVAGLVGLLYAGIIKTTRPDLSAHSIPFFPGMIIGFRIMMLVIIM